MAIIKCPECGREISDRAKTCPHCGLEITGPGKSFSAITVAVVVAALGILLGLYFAQNAREQLARQPAGTDAAEPTAEQAGAPATPATPEGDTAEWELAPLEPVVVDVPAEVDVPDVPPLPEELAVEQEQQPEDVEEEDDFEEVIPEEEEQTAAPEEPADSL